MGQTIRHRPPLLSKHLFPLHVASRLFQCAYLLRINTFVGHILHSWKVNIKAKASFVFVSFNKNFRMYNFHWIDATMMMRVPMLYTERNGLLLFSSDEMRSWNRRAVKKSRQKKRKRAWNTTLTLKKKNDLKGKRMLLLDHKQYKWCSLRAKHKSTFTSNGILIRTSALEH